jgi:hypothetical protein
MLDRLLMLLLLFGGSWRGCDRQAQGKACGKYDAQELADADHSVL